MWIDDHLVCQKGLYAIAEGDEREPAEGRVANHRDRGPAGSAKINRVRHCRVHHRERGARRHFGCEVKRSAAVWTVSVLHPFDRRLHFFSPLFLAPVLVVAAVVASDE